MPKPREIGALQSSTPSAAKSGPEGVLVTTRIDPPHQIAAAEPAPIDEPLSFDLAEVSQAIPVTAPSSVPSWAAPPNPLALPPAQTFEQIQSHAAQLATQLGKQQASLDHREAEVNARAAAVENQVRAGRLWLLEKLAEIEELKADGAANTVAPTADAEHDPDAVPADAFVPADPFTFGGPGMS
ncbi:MAG TPA: hypothetical protein VMF30_09810, partial [Pirellulales bacterium]|nr:hypothetical protein [Pirellulales bacterium]